MSTWNESDLIQFGRRLAAARKQVGVNQTELASWAGIGRPTLSRYERGEVAPTADVLAALASRLQPHGVSLEWLLYGSLDDSNGMPLVRLKRFGSLVGLRFTRGGEAEVLMSESEVYRFLEACGTLEASRPKPSQEVLDAINFLVEHFSECEERLNLLADVPIAVHGARLVPTIPDWDTREDLSRWSVFGGMEPDQSQKSEPEPDSGNQADNRAHQEISGEGHQIAGGNIENKGSVSIGRRYKK